MTPSRIAAITTLTLVAILAMPPCACAQQFRFPPPTKPAETIEDFRLPPGLKIELAAAEPLVADPIDIAWGADGRMWVVEMGDYPVGKARGGGRIRVLTDRDGDGRYDGATTFLDRLPFPTSVMPWRKGAMITAAPELIYAEDTDGDGVADRQEVILRGFGEGNQQHRVNSLRWGLDNWISIANGDSNGTIESVATGEKLDIRGRDLRVRPDAGEIDATTGRAQYGRNRDDWGNWFGCNNSNPLWHYVLDDYYLRRNSHGDYPKGINQLLPKAAEVYPASETVARFNDFDRADRFTSASGVMPYRDSLLFGDGPLQVFVCEPVHNLVHRAVVTPDGSTFTAQRPKSEQQSEFLTSTDNWFRPVAVQTGPDGALYVVDMYRAIIEHPQWIPQEVQQHVDLRAGANMGRIYRIVPADRPLRKVPRLDQATPEQLVAALASPNGWQRDMAHQLLVAASDKTPISTLVNSAANSDSPLARLHALCVLDGLQALPDSALSTALADEHPQVRRHAIRLSEPRLSTGSKVFINHLVELLRDEQHPQVRLQAAYSLGVWPDEQAGQELWRLLAGGESDEYLVAAAVSSLGSKQLLGALTALCAADDKVEWRTKPSLAAFREQVIVLGLKSGDETAVKLALAALFPPNDAPSVAEQLAALAPAFRWAAGQQTPPSWLQSKEVTQVTKQGRGLLADDKAPPQQQAAAVPLLGWQADSLAGDLRLLGSRLASTAAPEVQTVAITRLASIDDHRAAEILLSDIGERTPAARRQILAALLARPNWTGKLLVAVEEGAVAAIDIDTTTRQQLLEHPRTEIREQAAAVFAAGGESDREQAFARLQAVLTMKGDPDRGRHLFRKHCSSCHRVENEGHAVGPDLAALKDRSSESLLVAVLDPNRAVEDKYLAYTLITMEGLLHNGLITEETTAAITLAGQDGAEVVVARDDIDLLQRSEKGLMPEGFERDLSPQDIADLIACVQNFGRTGGRAAVEPTVVRADAEGRLALSATAGTSIGPNIKFMPSYQAFGWFTAEDRVEWKVSVPTAQEYEVWLEWSVSDDASGKPFQFVIGGQQVKGKIERSGSWETFRWLPIGRVKLAAGEHQAAFAAHGKFDGPLMDLRAIELRPVQNSGDKEPAR